MSELDISIVTLFKQYYPIIDHTKLNNDMLAILIENMFEVEKTKYSDKESEIETDTNSDIDIDSDPVIEENYMIATKLIPNMIESGDMICVQGRLNKIPVNILFDSGCQTSTTFTSSIKNANLEHLIDKKSQTICNGINGATKTCGMVWCTQLEFKINPELDDYIGLPIKLSILDDIKNKTEIEQNIEPNIRSVDILIGTDFMKASNVMINFSKNIITLNDLELVYK